MPGGSDANLGSIQGRDAQHPWREIRKVTQRLFLQNDGQAGKRRQKLDLAVGSRSGLHCRALGHGNLWKKGLHSLPRKCTEQEDRGTLFDARMRSEKGGAASQPAPKKSSCIALSPAPPASSQRTDKIAHHPQPTWDLQSNRGLQNWTCCTQADPLLLPNEQILGFLLSGEKKPSLSEGSRAEVTRIAPPPRLFPAPSRAKRRGSLGTKALPGPHTH